MPRWTEAGARGRGRFPRRRPNQHGSWGGRRGQSGRRTARRFRGIRGPGRPGSGREIATWGGDDPPPGGCGGPSLASAGEGVLPRAGFGRRARRPSAPAFCGRPGRVVHHHPARLPVPGEHHVGGRGTQARELRRQPDPSGVGGHPRLAAGRPGRRRKPQSTIYSESGTTRCPPAPGSRRPAAFGGRGRRRPFTKPHVPSPRPPGFVLPRRTGDQPPSPSVQRRAHEGAAL